MTYSRHQALLYAHKWAYGRFPAYYDYSKFGGDCTNFISQCLYAGCGIMNETPQTGWYYHSPAKRAPAWTGVEFLYRFLTTNQGVGPYASEFPQNRVLEGDIIQLSFDGRFYEHSLFIVETNPEILVATHTDDSDNRPLKTYRYQLARFLHIEGVRG